MGYALAEAASERGARSSSSPRPLRSRRLPAAPSCPSPALKRCAPPSWSTCPPRPSSSELPPSPISACPAVAPEKLRREGSLHLDLEPTEDILRAVAAAHRPGTLVIAFAAEMDSSIARAREKLLAKGADAIVLNDVSQPGIGFDSDLNAATFVTREHAIDIPEMTKREMADRILDQVRALRAGATVSPALAW